MQKAAYEPPTCPFCEEPLTRVFENVYETYSFNRETGTYTETNGVAEMKCPDCGCDLYDVFEHGVCNYDAEEGPNGEPERA